MDRRHERSGPFDHLTGIFWLDGLDGLDFIVGHIATRFRVPEQAAQFKATVRVRGNRKSSAAAIGATVS